MSKRLAAKQADKEGEHVESDGDQQELSTPKPWPELQKVWGDACGQFVKMNKGRVREEVFEAGYCLELRVHGVVGFLPLLPLHGWFAVLVRVAFLPTPGLRESKIGVSGVQGAMY